MTDRDRFIWGVATSSYQIEGAWNEEGRGRSIWDEFSRQPGRTRGATGDFAGDHYHRWREDIALMKELGVNAYRFSISWPRIFPEGGGPVNEAGVRFYSDLIDALLAAGIEPWVTLYHWDLPLQLQRKNGGWMSGKTVEAFVQYAEFCFFRYGDRVKNWITLNEPWCSAVLGHGFGTHAPGRKSEAELWVAGHNLLRAHAKAVQIYRTAFQTKQGGQIGLVMNCDWREPLTDSDADRDAAELALEFMLAWFADPVYSGDYPGSMKVRLGTKLPEFTADEKQMLKGSSDFFGLNHYSTYFALATKHTDSRAAGNAGVFGTDEVELRAPEKVSVSAMNWPIVPWGLSRMLHWIDHRYRHPAIYITENGVAGTEPDVKTAANDTQRCEFFRDYIRAALHTRDEGVDLRGYFAWCLLDTFEWAWGFDVQFGLVRADMKTGKRTPKNSFYAYQKIIRQNTPGVHAGDGHD
ncbi:MAG: GH1 family beta-glucosidase [Kiritimatiellales bacterium]|jgi:beta-glucosidase